jgi:hypothetical protein
VRKVEINPYVHETRKEQKIRGRYPIDRGRYEPFASGDEVRGADRIADLEVGASRKPYDLDLNFVVDLDHRGGQMKAREFAAA